MRGISPQMYIINILFLQYEQVYVRLRVIVIFVHMQYALLGSVCRRKHVFGLSRWLNCLRTGRSMLGKQVLRVYMRIQTPTEAEVKL